MNQSLQEFALGYLLQHAPVLLLVVSHDGEILRANQYTSKILGAGLISKNVSEITTGISVSDLVALSQTPERTRLWNFSTESNRAQTMKIRAYKVEDDLLVLGEPDADDLQKVTFQLFSLNNEMNNTARELHKKNAELEQLSQLKTQFLGMAAHDLRTPLNAVMLLCDLLSSDAEAPLSPGQNRFVGAIGQAAEKMRVLIEDFLNSAVIESGNLALDLQPVVMNAIIERVVHVQQHLASSRNMTLKVDLPSDCPSLQSDPGKLEQVLNNLVSNAIEYSSPNSEIQIRCSFSKHDVTVSVKDFGLGIAPEDLSKLFRPFSTIGAKKGSGQKSTGLGLFLSQKIVEAHQGRIRVESTPKVGSTFYFSLPYFG